MRVIPPSYEILDHLDEVSLAVRIESCGRICYKSEDKISEGSAEPFVRGIIKRGHNSVTEMAVITLMIEVESNSIVQQFFACLPKFLQVDRVQSKELLVTGSVRAFREVYAENPGVKLVKAITGFLAGRFPLLFDDLAPPHGWVRQSGVLVEEVGAEERDQLPAHLLARHRFVAVKFTVNRAVTH